MSLYVADQLSHPPPPNPPIGYGKIHRVTSAPSSDLGSDGDEAVNMTTGDIYRKASGTWSLLIAGAGVATQVYEGRDPLPPDDTTQPAISFPTGGGTLTQWPAGGPAWV
jgi:hypothetical protein